MGALQESKDVCHVVVEWLFKDPQGDCVKRIDEVFFFDIEAGSCADLDDLKSAKKASNYILDVELLSFRWLKLTEQVLSEDIDQVKDYLNIDELRELWNS